MFLISQLGLGGAQRQLILLIDGLLETHEIYVGFLQKTKEPVNILSELRKKAINIADFSRPFLNNPFLQIFEVASYIRRHRIQIVQTFLYRANIIGTVGALLGGASKIVASVRGIASWNRSSKSVFYAWLERIVFLWVDAVTCNAAAVKDYVIQRGTSPSKVKVIHNGLDFAVMKPNRHNVKMLGCKLSINNRSLVVGSVLRFDRQKDIPTFLKAAVRIHDKCPSARFVLVGGGAEEESAKHFVRVMNARDFVHLVGPVTKPYDYISLFDVAVLSSSSGEGLSNFVMEAMALGKPVVMTDVGGARELVVDGVNGFVVPPEDPEALSEKILILLKDKKLRIAMGKQSRRIINILADPGVMVQAYRELYMQPLRN